MRLRPRPRRGRRPRCRSRGGGSGGLRGGRDTGEVAFDGALGAVTDAQLGELGPPGQLVGDDVGRPSLHNNPARHEFAGFVSTSPQQLLNAAAVGFELGHMDSGVLLVPPVACQHPQLAEVVEGVLTERSHQLLGLALAQLTRAADMAG